MARPVVLVALVFAAVVAALAAHSTALANAVDAGGGKRECAVPAGTPVDAERLVCEPLLDASQILPFHNDRR